DLRLADNPNNDKQKCYYQSMLYSIPLLLQYSSRFAILTKFLTSSPALIADPARSSKAFSFSTLLFFLGFNIYPSLLSSIINLSNNFAFSRASSTNFSIWLLAILSLFSDESASVKRITSPYNHFNIQ